MHDEDVHYAGTMRFEAELDLADALDLDRALAHGAATLKALGSVESLDHRRAAALGDLARTQTALDLLTGRPVADRASGPHPDTRRRKSFLPPGRSSSTPTSTPASIGDAIVFGPTGRLEEGQRLVLLDHVKHWCGDSRTTVTIKPVIDLNRELSTPAYEVPDRIREMVVLRDRTCVFPWCTRPARGCDIDHVIPYDHHAQAEGRPQPGPTTTSNLAALCRRHHRLKTHTTWRYRDDSDGAFEWTSPHGHHSAATAPAPPPSTSDPPDRP